MSYNQEPKVIYRALEHTLSGHKRAHDLRSRPMFGGIMAYVKDSPFASMSKAGLALKLSPRDRKLLLEEKGARPLRYKPDDPPSQSYTLVPDHWIKSPDLLLPWVLKSMDYCQPIDNSALLNTKKVQIKARPIDPPRSSAESVDDAKNKA